LLILGLTVRQGAEVAGGNIGVSQDAQKGVARLGVVVGEPQNEPLVKIRLDEASRPIESVLVWLRIAGRSLSTTVSRDIGVELCLSHFSGGTLAATSNNSQFYMQGAFNARSMPPVGLFLVLERPKSKRNNGGSLHCWRIGAGSLGGHHWKAAEEWINLIHSHSD
jgi:hypothetical protein